jgi:two-component system, OmpR family, sensor histidine kinase MprB
MTLRRRLTVISASALVVAVVGASGAVFLSARALLRDQVDATLRSRAEELIGENDVNGGGQSIPVSGSRGEVGGYVQVITPRGAVLSPGSSGQERFPVTSRARAVAAGRQDSYLADATVAGIHYRVLTTPLPDDLALQVARPLTTVDATLRRLLWILLAATGGGVALAVGLGRVVTRAALRPVGDLMEATERIATTKDLTGRIDTSGTDELGRLAQSFNEMLSALDASRQAQQRLAEDASHELRTPLTSLRTDIDVLRRSANLSPPERELLMDVVEQLEEMSGLVSDVIELARGAEPSESQYEEVRFDAIADRAITRARRRTPDAPISAALEPCLVQGSAPDLERAVTNLVDNATKWSPPGATIDVVLRGGELSVRDQGPGIRAADLPLVFDRFYRAADARRLPGSGLGLAIVRQIALSHGGSVSAESPPEGGALLRMRLPTREVGTVLPEESPADQAPPILTQP